MDVFRQEAVAAVKVNHELKVKGFEDIEGTVDFMEKMQKWIAIHDISSTT